jgi:hypothetical protein
MPRPRRAGKRTKSGRPRRAYQRHPELRDQGTPEGQRRRAALVNGAPVELAATVSGILFARGFISAEQKAAADRYAGLHRTAFGPAWRQMCPLAEAHGGPTIPDDRLIRLRQLLDELHARMTPEQRKAVADVAVYGQIPDWFFAARLKLWMLPEDEQERDALVSGLDALAGG